MKTLQPFVCALIFCSGAACAAETPVDTPRTATAAVVSPVADAPHTTAGGHRFLVPAGWSLSNKGPAQILTPPETGSQIALVEVAAATADAAVAAAWKTLGAEPRWPLKLASERPARDGWSEVRVYRYEAPSAEKRTVIARALRYGERWTVALHDIDNAVGEKRDTQIEVIHGGLWAKGYARESFAGRKAHKLDAARLATLTGFVDEARQRFDVPGVALGIVQDGKVVFAGGFGERELGKADKVDKKTLFFAASNAKPLTTLMLAKLVEAGKFAWDTPVTSVYPDFRLGDAETTRAVRMRHLLCACTGMPRQDMEWIFGADDATPASVMQGLASMRPTSRFGELYQYSNPMGAAAGYVGGQALYPGREFGAAYDEAMQKLVFDPLRMKSTTFDFARAQRGNHAAPHARNIDGATERASMGINYAGIPTRPEGGVWSNVEDLLRYVQMELDRGMLPDGRRYIAEAPLLERRVQQVSRGIDLGYGMGLKLDNSGGTPLLHHGGTMVGYISDLMWLPEHGVGAVILTNADEGIAVRSLFRRRLLEVLFDGKPEAVADLAARRRRLDESAAAERKGLAVPAQADATARLAPRYRHATLGELEVVRKDGRTWFDFGTWQSEVASQRDDNGAVTFVTISPGENGYRFIAGGDGDARSLLLRSGQFEYRFDQTAASHGSDAPPVR